MSTTTLPINIYDLTAFQILRLVSSSDLDASEFGKRYTDYLALVAKAQRTDAEQAHMQAILHALTWNYANAEFREHLTKVLQGE